MTTRRVFYDGVSLDAGEKKLLVEVTEGGKLLYLNIYTVSAIVQFKIFLDGRMLRFYNLSYTFSPTMLNSRMSDQKEGLTVSNYAAGYYGIAVTLPLEWERSLEVHGYNPEASSKQVDVAVLYDPAISRPFPIAKPDIQTPTEEIEKAWWQFW